MSGAPDLTRDLGRLPGPDRFFEEVAADVVDGRCVILELGRWLESDLAWEILRGRLQSFTHQELDLAQAGANSGAPVAFLAEALGVPAAYFTAVVDGQADSGAALRDDERGRLPQVAWLGRFEALCAEAQATWLDFLAGWSRQRQGDVFEVGPVFVVAVPVAPPADATAGSVKLSRRCWRARLSGLEVQLTCQVVGRHDDRARAAWREHLLPSLAGDDLRLCQLLWDTVFEDVEGLATSLAAVPWAGSWRPETLLVCADQVESLRSGAAWPEALSPAWGAGMVHETLEHGVELTSPALVALGHKGAIAHRVWRGQLALISPRLDEFRLRACTHLAREYGPRWPDQFEPPRDEREYEAVKVSGYAAGLGHVASVLSNCKRRRDPVATAVSQLAYDAMALRNDLSHNRSVGFERFRIFADEYDDVRHLLPNIQAEAPVP